MVAVLAVLSLMAVNVGAQDYPKGPINYWVAFPAGGESDIEIRALQPFLEKSLGVPLIINYVPGAGGALCWSKLAAAKPDGYTIGGVNMPANILQPEFTSVRLRPVEPESRPGLVGAGRGERRLPRVRRRKRGVDGVRAGPSLRGWRQHHDRRRRLPGRGQGDRPDDRSRGLGPRSGRSRHPGARVRQRHGLCKLGAAPGGLRRRQRRQDRQLQHRGRRVGAAERLGRHRLSGQWQRHRVRLRPGDTDHAAGGRRLSHRHGLSGHRRSDAGRKRDRLRGILGDLGRGSRDRPGRRHRPVPVDEPDRQRRSRDHRPSGGGDGRGDRHAVGVDGPPGQRSGLAVLRADIRRGNSLLVQYRTVFGGATKSVNVAAGALPQYLQIQRIGDGFTASSSPDGTTYALVPGSSATDVMPASVMAGLAASSGVNGTAAASTIDSVVVGAPGPAPLPAAPPSPCPTGWTCNDVGNPAAVGDQSLSASTWTVKGGGTATGNNVYTDQLHYVWGAIAGDATLSARVATQPNTSGGAQAGLEFRANSTDPGATFYGAFVTPTKGIEVVYRSAEGLRSALLATASGAAPAYLRDHPIPRHLHGVHIDGRAQLDGRAGFERDLRRDGRHDRRARRQLRLEHRPGGGHARHRLADTVGGSTAEPLPRRLDLPGHRLPSARTRFAVRGRIHLVRGCRRLGHLEHVRQSPSAEPASPG